MNEATVAARPTAIIAETTTWEAFPALWPELLTEVREAVRGNELVRPGPEPDALQGRCAERRGRGDPRGGDPEL